MTDNPALRPVDFDPFGPAAGRPVDLPLTEPQVEMWTAAAMGREANCSYNQCFAFTLEGPLRVESLRVSLDHAMARHEALRAVIAPDGTGQTIRPPFSVEMPLLDVSSLDPTARQRELDRLLELECETPFDLAEGPLVRAFVVRESAERHLFVLTAHHIVCDGWSSSVLFSELGLLYAADRVGIAAQLGPAASYRDYVAEQTSHDHLTAAAADEEYWAAQYPAGAPVLDLPLTGTRPATKTYRSGRENLLIDEDLYVAIKQTGARSGATLFATLLAGFEVLLSRLSGQSDFVVGIPFAGQHQLENTTLVAHCVSTVPLRATLDPESPFVDHLRAVGQDLARAQEHSLLTFGSLVRRLQITRDPSRTPLVATTFAIDKVGAPFDFGDLSIASLSTPRAYSNFDLQVNVVDSGSDLIVECDYNVDLFAPSTIRRWLSHFENLLRGIVATPGVKVFELPLLGAEELAAVLGGGDAIGSAGRGCLHERFEQQMRLGADRVAVVCGEESLSFRELDRRANALALRLRSLGVGPDVLVGLRSERSLSVVVGVLGILKAGGAYLPLDPAYPRERVEFMLADSGVGVVVTESAFVSDFVAGVELVVVDADREEAAEGPSAGVGPDNLAYVMYTSGSTGRPKGVLISHCNVTRLFDSTEEWFRFGEDDVWTLFHSYAFDFSVWEMWGALLYGGRLVVVPYWVSRSPEQFRELVLTEGVTVLNQTPSAFRQYIVADLQAGPPASNALRHVIFGGEALELSSLRPWLDRYGDTQPRLVNMYGITETTVHVTYRQITLADLEAGAGSVIGVPIRDLRVLLLDSHGMPAPTGVAGELYVGGAGVSRGYLNRPELTAERFVTDPFGGPDILYRSGDLARRLENGDLEYLGRIDEQVKIRGFRIELGEIETLINQHPDVNDAVVIVREATPNDRRLIAYIVAPGQTSTLTDTLKDQLKTQLPDYMIPAQIISIETLPLTANGKLDRRALPAPDYTNTNSNTDTPHTPPSTPTERTLAGIWGAALGISALGIHDNFFDAGGDSLKAAQMVTAVRSAFQVDAGMRHLFERPTIAGLAEIVDILAVAVSGTPAGGDNERVQVEI